MGLLRLPTVTVAPAPCSWNWNTAVRGERLAFSSGYSLRSRSIAKVGGGFEVRAFFPNPSQEPIFKEALKEPVAFVGGIFAGLLRLDLKEEPLREWVARTVEASGITPEEISKKDVEGEEQVAEQIEIE
ncbi:hypothetical protein ACS0TY_035191 [Phlomoides rotata]